MREVVKEFVESAVRGCLVDALCGNGRAQQVIFRLNRRVDAFELVPCNGGASCTIALTDVEAAHVGGDAWAQHEVRRLVTGLDASCSVLEFTDGRCLALRFYGRGSESQARIFTLCMHTFASELHRLVS